MKSKCCMPTRTKQQVTSVITVIKLNAMNCIIMKLTLHDETQSSESKCELTLCRTTNNVYTNLS